MNLTVTVADLAATEMPRWLKGWEADMTNIKSLAAGLYLTIAALGMSATNAHAVLIDNGSTTIDNVAGLEWLDVTETVNQSFNDVFVGGFGGFAAAGYQLATSTQICSLFTALGDTLPNCLLAAGTADLLAPSSAATLVSLLGATTGGGVVVCGRFDSGLIGSGNTGVADIHSATAGGICGGNPANSAATFGSSGNLDSANTSSGLYLVRSAETLDAPGSLAVLALGLAGLCYARRNRAV